MKKVILSCIILLVSVSSQARQLGENDACFSLSLDGNKISHIVVYSLDYDNQIEGQSVPTFNARVFDYQSNLITGSTLDEVVVNDWKAKSSYDGKPYPAKHHVAFSQTKLNGQKVSYDVKLHGIAQDIGSGVTILRGQSEVLIDGKKVVLPSVKTLNSCPDPSSRKDIQEVESLL